MQSRIDASEWHVSVRGNDAGDGGPASPFRTIERGLQAAQPGDTVRLAEGSYREKITPPRDGTPMSPITIENEPHAVPVISACDVVEGPWVPEGEGIFGAPVAVTLPPRASNKSGAVMTDGSTLTTGLEQVFVDGVMQQEARFPNKTTSDPMDHESIPVSVSSNYVVSGPGFVGKPNEFFAGARFLGMIHKGWALQGGVVTGSSGSNLTVDPETLSYPWWPNKDNTNTANGTGFLYGIRNLLDVEGEWVLSHKTGAPSLLSLKIGGGGTPEGHLVEIKVRNWCVSLQGRRHIVLKGLHFQGGALALTGSDLLLDHCDISFPSHFLSFPKGYSVDGDLPWGGGVIIGGSNNIVRGCTVSNTAGSGIMVEGSENLVCRTLVTGADYSGTYGAGIALGGYGNRIEFNTVKDTGRDCVGITGGGHEVMYNDLSRNGRLALDGGMVYSYGQNGEDAKGRCNRIAYNWVHDAGNPEDPNASGIYLDNYSRNFTVDHNVAWNLGSSGKHKGVFFNSPGYHLSAYHNTLIDCLSPESGTWCKFPQKNDDAAYWTTNNVGLDYAYQNNLVIPHGTSPDALLENASALNFLPKVKGSAIDPTATNGLIDWFSPDGKVNVPSGYRLAMKDKSYGFKYREVTGSGVLIPGINEGFVGSAPDNGAYESGPPPWKPGHKGVSSRPVSP